MRQTGAPTSFSPLRRSLVLGASASLAVGCERREQSQGLPPADAPRSDTPSPLEFGFNVLAFLVDHPFIKFIAFLRLVHAASQLVRDGLATYDKERSIVVFRARNEGVTGWVGTAQDARSTAGYFSVPARASSPARTIEFDRDVFLGASGIRYGDSEQVSQFDDRLRAAYSDCSTEVEMSQESRHPQKLLLRAKCMSDRGFSNPMTMDDYLDIKYTRYV